MLVKRGAGRGVARRRLRSRRRRPRALRPHRERAAHRPGHPQPPAGPHQARLTVRAPHLRRPRSTPSELGRSQGAGAARPSRQKATAASATVVGRRRPARGRTPCTSWCDHAEDGVGEQLRGRCRGSDPRRSPSLTWLDGVGHRDRPGRLAQRRARTRSSVAANSNRLVAGRGARPTTASTARMPSSMRSDRIVDVGDGLLLAAAQVLLGVAEDLDEELLLRVEVPVEDALAHAEAVDDLGHRRRVVARSRRTARSA